MLIGIIAFPVGPYLQVGDLNQALRKMHVSNMYNKLVFYLEACESGSMFEVPSQHPPLPSIIHHTAMLMYHDVERIATEHQHLCDHRFERSRVVMGLLLSTRGYHRWPLTRLLSW